MAQVHTQHLAFFCASKKLKIKKKSNDFVFYKKKFFGMFSVEPFLHKKLTELAVKLNLDASGSKDILYKEILQHPHGALELKELTSYFAQSQLFNFAAFVDKLRQKLKRDDVYRMIALYDKIDTVHIPRSYDSVMYLAARMSGYDKKMTAFSFQILKDNEMEMDIKMFDELADFTIFITSMKNNLKQSRDLINRLLLIYDGFCGRFRELSNDKAVEHLAFIMCQPIATGMFTIRAYSEGKGEICVYNKEKHVHTEFTTVHNRYGECVIMDSNGSPARTEYFRSHPRHGEMLYWDKKKKLLRIEFDATHPRCGEVLQWSNNQHIRTEFLAPHRKCGLICHLVDGVHCTSEYMPSHPRHGEICIFENGLHVRTEFGPSHNRNGEIAFWLGERHTHSIFLKGHRRHGEIVFWNDKSMHSHSKFETGHPREGETAFFDATGAHIRSEFLSKKPSEEESDAQNDSSIQNRASMKPIMQWNPTIGGYHLFETFPSQQDCLQTIEMNDSLLTTQTHIKQARRKKLSIVVFAWKDADDEDEPSHIFYCETSQMVHMDKDIPAEFKKVKSYVWKGITVVNEDFPPVDAPVDVDAPKIKKGKRARRRERNRNFDTLPDDTQATIHSAMFSKLDGCRVSDEQLCDMH